MFVKALFSPQAICTGMSNSGTWCVPRNIRCSKRCANPVFEGSSLRAPTIYNILIAASFDALSRFTNTRRPLANVLSLYFIILSLMCYLASMCGFICFLYLLQLGSFLYALIASLDTYIIVVSPILKSSIAGGVVAKQVMLVRLSQP